MRICYNWGEVSLDYISPVTPPAEQKGDGT